MSHSICPSVQPSTADTLERLPLGEQAYLGIKKMILENELKAGDHVNVSQLSERLSLGRSPIHLALHRLDQEGLIEILPRKGILVKGETLDSFLDLIAARELVEPFLAAQAAALATPALISSLEELITLGWTCYESGDRQGSMEIDRRFHKALYDAAGNQLLSDFASQLLDRSMLLWFKPSIGGGLQPNVKELEILLEAIKARDPECAAQKMNDHVGSIRNKFIG